MNYSKTISLHYYKNPHFNSNALQEQVSLMLDCTSLAIALTTENPVDKFLVSRLLTKNRELIIQRFGEEVEVVQIESKAKSTIITLKISKPASEFLEKYFSDKENYDPEEIVKSSEYKIKETLVIYFATALEALGKIVEKIEILYLKPN
jgi:hypothetical protein